MNSPETIRKARLARLECILLGMALAQDGDRDQILRELSADDFQSGVIGDCLEAIRTQDPESISLMRKHLCNWGLDASSGKVIGALISKVQEDRARREFSEAISSFQFDQGDSPEEFIERAELALTSIKEMVH